MSHYGTAQSPTGMKMVVVGNLISDVEEVANRRAEWSRQKSTLTQIPIPTGRCGGSGPAGQWTKVSALGQKQSSADVRRGSGPVRQPVGFGVNSAG